jgi:hypothetical protein
MPIGTRHQQEKQYREKQYQGKQYEDDQVPFSSFLKEWYLSIHSVDLLVKEKEVGLLIGRCIECSSGWWSS